MIDIKTTGPGGIKAADKKKATARAGAAGGPSFASLLEEAAGVSDVAEATAALPASPYAPIPTGDDERPPSSKKQAGRLLDALQDLAEDALSGQPTAALSKLQSYLSTSALDKDSLTEAQKQALDEVETRAAVEAEKLKS